MKFLKTASLGVVFSVLVTTTSAWALDVSTFTGLMQRNTAEGSAVEVGFSPEGTAETLVLKIIRSAKQSIRLAGYSFTSPTIVHALLEAKRRGIDVAVVVDHKNNISLDPSSKAKAALNLLVNAGIPTRTVARYAIHHDKFIVSDGTHVETGSFNFSAAAAKSNSENVIVVWSNPQLAKAYLSHWQWRYEQGRDYVSSY